MFYRFQVLIFLRSDLTPEQYRVLSEYSRYRHDLLLYPVLGAVSLWDPFLYGLDGVAWRCAVEIVPVSDQNVSAGSEGG